MSPVALTSENRTLAVFEVAYSWSHFYIVSIFLGFLIVCIICGNALVVLAVLTERLLRVVSNYLILSLAIADLLVAMIVMPLSLVHEISKVWWNGLPLCDLWICADVLLCTVSTLHLCAIAIERCLAVSSLAYLRHRSAAFVLAMVGICWVLATMVSLPARFHAKRQIEIPETVYDGICEINKEEGYTIYSNLLAFDLPMVFIVLIYARIYFTARRHIRKKCFAKYHVNSINKSGKRYQPPTPAPNPKSHHLCCYCWVYVMETKFHKNQAMPKEGLTWCSNKRTTNTEPPETVVAAAVTAMHMAATMISTSLTSEDVPDSTSVHALKNSHHDEESQVDDDPPRTYQPLTFDILRSMQKQKEERWNQEVTALGSHKKLMREPSVYTNCSSILYADDDSNSESLSSGMHVPTILPSNSKTIKGENPSATCQLCNFVPLGIYYRKRRQQRWLAQGRVINKKASEVMKSLSLSEPDSGFLTEEIHCLRERQEQKRERRTVRTLTVITVCFVLCWLPFNINALLSPFLGRIHPIGASVFLWLGYLNSLLNPIIYTLFSKEFRSAFRRIICHGPQLNCFR